MGNMNQPIISQQRLVAPRARKILFTLLVISVAVIIGLSAAQQPIFTIAGTLFVLLFFLILIWPEVSTLTVIFVIYTNAAAIAVQFHNVPYIVGAMVPLLLFIPLAQYLVVHRQKLVASPVLWLVLLFYYIQVVSAVFSKDIVLAFGNLTKQVTEGLILYFLITNTVRTSAALKRVIWVLLVAGALIGGLGFYQLVTESYDNNFGGFAQVSNAAFGTGVETIGGEVTQPRLAGSVGEQNRHAQVMLMLVPLGLFLIWGERSKLVRVLVAIATVLTLIGVITTFSRGAALGLVAMLVVMVLMRFIKPYQLAGIFIGAVLLLAAFPQYSTRILTLEGLVGLISDQSSISTITKPDSSLSNRTNTMLTAALVFADHPIIGVGPGMFPYYYQDYVKLLGVRIEVGNREAHDLYLGIAADLGITGLVTFLAILIMLLVNLNRTRIRWSRTQPTMSFIATGFFLSIVTYMVTGIGLHLAYPRFFWLIVALADVASRATATDDESGIVAH